MHELLRAIVTHLLYLKRTLELNDTEKYFLHLVCDSHRIDGSCALLYSHCHIESFLKKQFIGALNVFFLSVPRPHVFPPSPSRASFMEETH